MVCILLKTGIIFIQLFDLWYFIFRLAFTAILRWDGDIEYYMMFCVCIKCQLDFLSIFNFKYSVSPIYRRNFGCDLWTSLSIYNRMCACLIWFCPTMIFKWEIWNVCSILGKRDEATFLSLHFFSLNFFPGQWRILWYLQYLLKGTDL